MYGTYRQLITGSRNRSYDTVDGELPRLPAMSTLHYGKSSRGARYNAQINKL